MSTITMLVVGFAPVYLNKVEQTSLNKKEAASLRALESIIKIQSQSHSYLTVKFNMRVDPCVLQSLATFASTLSVLANLTRAGML